MKQEQVILRNTEPDPKQLELELELEVTTIGVKDSTEIILDPEQANALQSLPTVMTEEMAWRIGVAYINIIGEGDHMIIADILSELNLTDYDSLQLLEKSDDFMKIFKNITGVEFDTYTNEMRNRLEVEAPLIKKAVAYLHKINDEDAGKEFGEELRIVYHLRRNGLPKNIQTMIGWNTDFPEITEDQALRIMKQFLAETADSKTI